MKPASVVLCLVLPVCLLGAEPAQQARPPDPLVEGAQVAIGGFLSALDAFEVDVGRYPTQHEGLNVLIGNARKPGIERWKGPYLKGKEIPMDPWGTPYRYEVPEKGTCRLSSGGPDREFGTADDVTADGADVKASRQKSDLLKCMANLKEIGRALQAYCEAHKGSFPKDVGSLFESGDLKSLDVFVCPATATAPAKDLAAFRAGKHCDYLYFGEGLTAECQGHEPIKTVILSDGARNHEWNRYRNIWFADGRVRGYPGAESLEKLVHERGFFLPQAVSEETNVPQTGAEHPAPAAGVPR